MSKPELSGYSNLPENGRDKTHPSPVKLTDRNPDLWWPSSLLSWCD